MPLSLIHGLLVNLLANRHTTHPGKVTITSQLS